MRRDDLLKRGQDRSGGLVMGSAGIAPAQTVFAGQFVIDLDGQQSVGKAIWRCDQQVVRGSGGASEILLRPQAYGCFGCLAEGAHGNAVVLERLAGGRVLQYQPCDARKIAVPPGLNRHRPERFHTAPLGVLLVIEEEEALVPPDRASQRSAELVAVQPAHLGQEKIARVKHVVAPELEERTVKAVGARLRDQTDLAESGLPQLGCVGVGLYLELLDSVDGGAHGDVAELPGIVASAVQREIILVVSSADGNARAEAARSRSNREIEAARARGCSWHKQE